MSRILSTQQCRQLERELAELAAYRNTGLTPEAIWRLLDQEPAPLPLNLHEGWPDDGPERRMEKDHP